MIFWKNKIAVHLKINKDLPLSEFLNLLKLCHKKIILYVSVDKHWKFLHSLSAIKQINEVITEKKITLYFNTKDSIAKKNLEIVGISISNSIPKDCRDFFKEFKPEVKFKKNKVGNSFQSQEYEIIKVIKKNKKEHIDKAYQSFQSLSLKNKTLIIIAFIFSIGILCFLISLIIPKATIYISSEKKLVETVVNTNFIKTNSTIEDSLQDHGNNFHLYPIEFYFEDEIEFPVLSKVFEGQPSKGVIMLFNNYPEAITLKKGTRLQTEKGLLFLTDYYVRIPGTTKQTDETGNTNLVPGKARVSISANDVDIYQEIIGSKGNIKPQKLIIPGLTQYMQKFIWGENRTELTGGTTRWRREVQDSDIEAASEKLKNILLEKTNEQIQIFLTEHNAKQEKKLAVLPINDNISQELSKISFNEDILGKNLEYFNIKGKMLIKAFVFFEDSFNKFMQEHIRKKEEPHMYIDKINFASMIFRKFQETPTEIRVAVSLQGRQSYKINNETVEGQKFQDTLKAHIKGMKLDQGLKFLRNKAEINKVKIEVWPPMKKSFPLIPDNILIVEQL